MKNAVESNIVVNVIERDNVLEGVKNEQEILGRVKGLITHVGMPLVLTTQQVADYYEVSRKQIDNLIDSASDEFISDNSMIKMNGNELKDFKDMYKGILQTIDEGNRCCIKENEIPSSKNPFTRLNSLTLLNFRSVIRIGLMLQKSPVAKKLRDVLLDSLNDETVQTQIIYNIQEEERLQLAIFKADSREGAELAMAELIRYQKRHASELENKNTELTKANETWEQMLGVHETYDMNALAKFLSTVFKTLPNGKTMGRNNLMSWLREQKILMNDNQPYTKYINNFKITTHKHGYSSLIYHNKFSWMIRYIEKQFEENN